MGFRRLMTAVVTAGVAVAGIALAPPPVAAATLAGSVVGIGSRENPAPFGDTQAIVAIVTSTDPSLPITSGTVVFAVDGVNRPPAPIGIDGRALLSFNQSAMPVGTHSVTATYAGDANHTGSVSPALTQVITIHATTMTLTIAHHGPSTTVFPQTVNIEAEVTDTVPHRGGGIPTGPVYFVVAGTTYTVPIFFKSGTANLILHKLPAAVYSITATYGGDATHGTSSASLTHTVLASTTVVTLHPAANPSAGGQGGAVLAVTSIGGAQPGGGRPTGTTVFTVDGVDQPPTPVYWGGLANLPLSSLTPGTHTITATYSGDGGHTGSTSAPLIQTVVTTPTTATFSTFAAPATWGQFGLIHLNIHNAPTRLRGAPYPTGTVVITVDGVADPARTLVKGVATRKLSALSVGTHTITATYAGDANHTGSTSTTFTQTIVAAPTTIWAKTTGNPATEGQPGYVEMIVRNNTPAKGVPTPTGAVTFTVNGVAQPATAVDQFGMARFPISGLSEGLYRITGSYGGDAGHAGATSRTVVLTVRAGTTTTLSSAANPANYHQAGAVTADVTSLDKGGIPAGTVVFTVDGVAGTPIALAAGKARLKLATLSVGTHTITARYGGDAHHAPGTSTTTLVQVISSTTVVGLKSTADPTTLSHGGQITATVTRLVAASGTPTGTVVFTVDGVAGSPVALANGKAHLKIAPLGVGSHTVTATYSGDTKHNGGTSSALTQVVTADTTTVTLKSALNPAPQAHIGAITATVHGPGTIGGTVTFTVDGVPQATIPVGNGRARLKLDVLDQGTHTVTATYNGDTTHSGSTSASLTQVIT